MFGVPGALIAFRRPRNPVGWLMLAVGACFAVERRLAAVAVLASGPGSWRGEVSWWSERGSAIVVPVTLMLVLLLPDGRLPSPRWRPVVVGHGERPARRSSRCGAWARSCRQGGRPHVDPLELMLILPFLLGIAAVVQRLRTPQ